MFSIGPVSGASLFQILVEKIVARAAAADMRVPLYLMTSPATHQETLDYLRANENFGLPSEDLHVFCQGTMPAVDAESGRLLLASKHELALSPDGHGGMLHALVASGGLADIHRRNITTLFYCQVDNPLVEMCDPAFLGYHLLSGSELSTQVVAKRGLRDKVGNVVSVDGRLRIIEYSDLNPLGDELVARRGPGGVPIFWAGNTAIHVLDAAFLERMASTARALPFHLARKAVSHVDPSGRVVEPSAPNAMKFERFIFDLLPEARAAIVVEVDEARTFAPVKNAPGEASDTPESVQARLVELHAAWLREAGCEVAEGVAVEISPRFAQSAKNWPPACGRARRWPSRAISAESRAGRATVRHSMIFVSAILDDSAGAGGFEPRNDVPHDRLVENRVHVDPVLVGQARDGRLLQGRQQRQHLAEPLAGHVHHQAHFAFGRHRALEHQARCRRSSASSRDRRTSGGWR